MNLSLNYFSLSLTRTPTTERGRARIYGLVRTEGLVRVKPFRTVSLEREIKENLTSEKTPWIIPDLQTKRGFQKMTSGLGITLP